MFIQTVKTPNPNALKFFPGGIVTQDGVYDFMNASDAEVSPLATDLFRIEGITQVFYGHDFISVTKSDDFEWNILKPQIILTILNHYREGQSLFENNTTNIGHQDTNGDPIAAEIIGLLDKYVVPRLAADGGYVEFQKYKDGIVYLKLRGACASCPGATMTLKHGIKSLLMAYIPEITDVESAR